MKCRHCGERHARRDELSAYEVHAHFHDQPGNLLGVDDCGYDDCGVWEAANLLIQNAFAITCCEDEVL